MKKHPRLCKGYRGGHFLDRRSRWRCIGAFIVHFVRNVRSTQDRYALRKKALRHCECDQVHCSSHSDIDDTLGLVLGPRSPAFEEHGRESAAIIGRYHNAYG